MSRFNYAKWKSDLDELYYDEGRLRMKAIREILACDNEKDREAMIAKYQITNDELTKAHISAREAERKIGLRDGFRTGSIATGLGVLAGAAVYWLKHKPR